MIESSRSNGTKPSRMSGRPPSVSHAASHVRRRAEHRLPLAVVAEAPRLQHRGQADCPRPRRRSPPRESIGRERRRRDAERREELLLRQPFLRHFERPRRREDRHALGEPAGGLDRHVLELERDHIGRLCQFEERLEVVELAANMRATLARPRIGGRIETVQRTPSG